jgi:hypothetical protein
MYMRYKKNEYNMYHANGQLLTMVQLLQLGIECEFLEFIWILYY